MITKALVALAVSGGIGALCAVPAAAQTPPSYATSTTDEQVHGTIAAVNGRYSITVRDSRGFLDNVTLHQGTIINPTGLTLAAGQTVTILGTNVGNTLAANEIDTPYTNVSLVPLYPDYYGYPYPYGFGFGYEAGFRFGRGFGFGFRG